MTRLYPEKFRERIIELETLDRPLTSDEKEEYYDLKKLDDYERSYGMKIQDKNKKFMA